MKRKHYLIAALVVLAAGFGWAVSTDRWGIGGEGVYFNKDMVRLDSTYNLRLYNGSILLGDNNLTPSTTNTQTSPSVSAGGYYGLKVPITFTEAVTSGDVIVSSNVGTGKGIRSTTSSALSFIGICDGTYASGATGWVTVSGYAVVKTTGTVAIGDVLVSSATRTGGAGAAASPAAASNIGVALSAGAAAGDTVLVRLR